MKYVFWLVGTGLIGSCVNILITTTIDSDQVLPFFAMANQGFILIGLGYLASINSKLNKR